MVVFFMVTYVVTKGIIRARDTRERKQEYRAAQEHVPYFEWEKADDAKGA